MHRIYQQTISQLADRCEVLMNTPIGIGPRSIGMLCLLMCPGICGRLND